MDENEKSNFILNNFEDLEEAETKPQFLINTISRNVISQLIDLDRFSSFWKLKRVIAWIFRARTIWKKCRVGNQATLSYKEVCDAETFLLKMAQQDGFSKEIRNMELNEPVSKCSPIKELCPYLDEKSVLRVNGRLSYAWFLPYKRRNPILLPKKHTITNLIVREYHETNFHVFTKATMNNLQMKFWIPSLKQVLRSVEYKCVQFKMIKAKHFQPVMANLPLERQMVYSRPFSYTGIDFCGPFSLKCGRKTSKGWVLLITCMTTRAVHLEVVERLNADNTLLRLSDFMNRRGIPVKIRSDCASYFKYTKKRLHEILNCPKNIEMGTQLSRYSAHWRSLGTFDKVC